ncbi:MAG: response regulator [Deltaproteobacteria bacterium]|nr:response regulator [Deltaproteobacteria bacterium]
MPKKILLADDSVTIQKVISITLASEDYALEIVGEGNAAIAKIKAIKPDLVMADIAMPGKTGYEVCDFVKNDPELKKIPVILLAGTFEPLNKAEAQRVRADESIVKPFGSQEFVDKIKNLIEKAQAPEMAAPAAPAARPEITSEVWKSGEFLGASEEPEEASQAEPDLGFLEGNLFDEAGKDLGGGQEEQGFTDLSFDESKKKAPVISPDPSLGKRGTPSAATPAPPQQTRPHAAIPPAYVPPPPPPPPPPPKPFDFDSLKSESFGLPEEEPAQDFWTQPGAGISPEAPVAPLPRPPEPSYSSAPPPPPPPRVAAPAPPPPRPQAPAAAGPRAESVTKLVAQAAEPRIMEETTRAAGMSIAVSKDQIEDIVRKLAKDIIEEVAWEVVPELTEQIVSEEFNKFREVFLKAKQR